MTTSREFFDGIRAQGFDFFTGVPDSTFKKLLGIIASEPDLDYIPAVSEDLAIGVATGAYLGGKTPVVLMQNSGFGQSVNALSSLAWLYRIPLLLIIGWRGHDGKDAPEHLLLGETLPALLSTLCIPYRVLETATLADDLAAAVATMRRQRRPSALVLKKGILDADPGA